MGGGAAMSEPIETVFLEYKPEHYRGPDIAVTIKFKRTKALVAQQLERDVRALLDGSGIRVDKP